VTVVKILLVTGGCCHDYRFQAEAMQQAMKDAGAPAQWTIVNEGGNGTVSAMDELYIIEKTWPATTVLATSKVIRTVHRTPFSGQTNTAKRKCSERRLVIQTTRFKTKISYASSFAAHSGQPVDLLNSSGQHQRKNSLPVETQRYR